jgi:hypothetical protein
MSRRLTVPVMLSTVLLALPAAARAQATPAGEQTGSTPAGATPYEQVVSVQPLGIPALWFSAEFERKATQTVTWGLGGSYF